jgi:16S rRNA (guanine(966)-N(2))-methyltransferase RsmD
VRVIAGRAKGRRLKMVPGDSTRPVRDIVKESLFNILGSWVQGSRWLDLFAGTGGIGIEALSRGAAYCLFLDSSRAAVRTIHENLGITGLSDLAQVRQVDAFTLLSRPPSSDEDRFEVIYVAPPQYRGVWLKALKAIDTHPDWLFPDGLAIAQIDPVEFAEPSFERLVLYDQRRYGSTLLCFYEKPGE